MSRIAADVAKLINNGDYHQLVELITTETVLAEASLRLLLATIPNTIHFKDKGLLLTNPFLVNAMEPKQVFDFAIAANDVTVMQNLLRRHGSGLKQQVIRFLNRKVRGRLTDEKQRMRGLLYAYSQGLLPAASDFDFLMPDYFDHCYQHSQRGTAEQLKVHQISHTDSENSLEIGDTRSIIATARKMGIQIDSRRPLNAVISYIGEQLDQLEGHHKALDDKQARCQFIPDVQADSANPVDADGKVMTESQQQTARLHTALRLLRRDSHEGQDPYFKSASGDFDTIVAYCFEFAKRVGGEQEFITALVDIRRGHNLDEVHGKPVYADSPVDRPTCYGSEGHLFQNFVLNQSIYNLQHAAGGDDLIPFDPQLMVDLTHSLVCDTMEQMMRNFIGEDHHYLAMICWLLQFNISNAGIASADDFPLQQQLEQNVEKAIDYLLDNKVDIEQSLLLLMSSYNVKSEHELTPARVAQMKQIIKKQLQTYFGLQQDARFEHSIVTHYQQSLFNNIYPKVLCHFLYVDTETPLISFDKLVEFVDCIPPANKSNVYKEISQRAAELIEFYVVRDYNDNLNDLFIKLDKLPPAVLKEGDFSASILSISSRLLDGYQLHAFHRLYSSLLDKHPEIVQSMDRLFVDQLAQTMTQCFVHRSGESMNKLKNLLRASKELSSDNCHEVFHLAAIELLQNGQVNDFYLLQNLAKSFRLELSIPQDKVKVLKRSTKDLVGSIGSRRLIGKKKTSAEVFAKLQQNAQRGNAYSSFELAKLYQKGFNLVGEHGSISKIKNPELAQVFALIALNQAERIGDAKLMQTITDWLCAKDIVAANLPEIFHQKMLEAIQTNDEKAIDYVAIIASHIDYYALLQQSQDLEEKQIIDTIIADTLTGKDTKYSDNLIHVFRVMAERNCKAHQGGGWLASSDPGLLLQATLHQRDINLVLDCLNYFKGTSVSITKFMHHMQEALGDEIEVVSTKLNRIYDNLKNHDSRPLVYSPTEEYARERAILLRIIERYELDISVRATTPSRSLLLRHSMAQSFYTLSGLAPKSSHSDSRAPQALKSEESYSEQVTAAIEAVATADNYYQADEVIVYLRSNYELSEREARQRIAQAYFDTQPSSSSAAKRLSPAFFASSSMPPIDTQLRAIANATGHAQYKLFDPTAACSSSSAKGC